MGPRLDALKLTNLLLFATCTCNENQRQGSNYWLWSFTLVTSNKYPIFLHQKVVEKQVVEEIMEAKHKEREEKWNERMVNSLTTID